MMRAREVFAVRLAIAGGNQLHALCLLASSNQLIPGDIWALIRQSREIDVPTAEPTPWLTPLLDDTP
jgi:hypothetical protein